MVSQTLLSELRMILKQDYGVELEAQMLSDFANNLVGFFELLLIIEKKTNTKQAYENK